MVFFSVIEIIFSFWTLAYIVQTVQSGANNRHGSFNKTSVTPKTTGSPWPLPQKLEYGSASLSINSEQFHFKTTCQCDVVQKALTRYYKIIFPTEITREIRNRNLFLEQSQELHALNVSVQDECEPYPYFGMNEKYNLSIWSNGSASLQAFSVWGALRGLETFSQLIYSDPPSGNSYRIRTATIEDWPRFPHRGILLDTSRHFVPLQSIMETLELMAENKFNVLHWHIVDDPSFPYQSAIFPKVTEKGAYSPRHVYSRADISRVLEYARLRGVRVVPEFDTPGHTQSWGDGQPGLLTQCFKSDGNATGEFALLDVSKDSTWDFILALFREILATFPDKYIHLGGDEVSYQYSCWMNNPAIKNWMSFWGFKKAEEIEEYYFRNFLPLLERARPGTGYLVWQEVLDHKINVRQDTIAHVWKGNTPLEYYAEMNDVTSRGYSAILSSCWYLNYIHYGNDWHSYYTCDPQGFNGSETQSRLVLGGEACMWGEFVDSTNLTPRLWPRASVVAERLWSAGDVKNVDDATPRLEEHRCRLMSRGFPVEPMNGPGFCPKPWSTTQQT